jgi:hypothetical protein
LESLKESVKEVLSGGYYSRRQLQSGNIDMLIGQMLRERVGIREEASSITKTTFDNGDEQWPE